jgi:hypothetical protein
MPDPQARELTLYVESKKVITSFYRPPAAASAGPEIAHPTGQFNEAARPMEEAFFLSDDQARCVALAEFCAERRGYTIRIVDIAKVGRTERFIAEHLRSVQTFPVLVAPDGQRLEGTEAFTEERLCELMPTEMHALRAFTYVKVKGGDLDRIRQIVLKFPEVRELHLLTGDWDVFVVLEFPASESKKRQILDFVTEKIRGIPEVLDTSTLVPEFSVTKFAT